MQREKTGYGQQSHYLLPMVGADNFVEESNWYMYTFMNHDICFPCSLLLGKYSDLGQSMELLIFYLTVFLKIIDIVNYKCLIFCSKVNNGEYNNGNTVKSIQRENNNDGYNGDGNYDNRDHLFRCWLLYQQNLNIRESLTKYNMLVIRLLEI
jgi:hypothetical protein